MITFLLWLWADDVIDRSLEQSRRNGLTPTERAAEDTARIKAQADAQAREDRIEKMALKVVLLGVLATPVLIFAIVSILGALK
jgi:hypothetical protein